MVRNIVIIIVDTIFGQIHTVVTITIVDPMFIMVIVIVMILLPLVSSSCSFLLFSPCSRSFGIDLSAVDISRLLCQNLCDFTFRIWGKLSCEAPNLVLPGHYWSVMGLLIARGAH